MRTTSLLRKLVKSNSLLISPLLFGVGALGVMYVEREMNKRAEVTRLIDQQHRQNAQRIRQFTQAAEVINELNSINDAEQFEMTWGFLTTQQIEYLTSTPKLCMALMLSVGANLERIYKNNYVIVYERNDVIDDDKTELKNRDLRTKLSALRDKIFVDIYAGASENIISARDHLSAYLKMFEEYEYSPQAMCYIYSYRSKQLTNVFPAAGFSEYFAQHKDIAELFANNRQLFDYFIYGNAHTIKLHQVITSREKAIEYLLRAEQYEDVRKVLYRLNGTLWVKDAVAAILDPNNEKLFKIIADGITYEGELHYMLSFMKEGGRNVDLSLNQKNFLKRLGANHPVLQKLGAENTATLFKKGYSMDVVTHLLTEVEKPQAGVSNKI